MLIRHSSVAREGQVRIPQAMRKALGIRAGCRLVLIAMEDHLLIRVQRRRTSMRSGFGMVKSHRPSISPSFSFSDKASLAQLIAEGRLSWNGSKPRIKSRRFKLSNDGKPLSKMVLEDRG